jgi:AAA domain/Bifunctional DNA primase/polymerase, N-terminal
VDSVTGFERSYNIGFQTNGWIVLDVDTKRGKYGLKTFAECGLELDTLTCGTASGGLHLVYHGFGRPVGQSPLGRDVDVRSHNGYVVGPGSSIDGRKYEIILDIPPAEFPTHLRHLLKAPRERTATSASSIELDQPEFIELAAHYLRTSAPPAIEGQNGDDATYRVACRVRDFGVSADTALDLILELWNPTCEPPWESSELQHKIENAYRYATSPAGSATAQAAFESLNPVEPPNATYRHGPNGTPYHFGNVLAVGEIERRPFVLGDLLLNRTVTALVAGPGAGKSLMKLLWAVHLALGKDFMGHKCYRPGKSVVFDAEDDVAEQSRRLHAICVAYGFDINEVRKRVSIVSSDEIMLQLTTPGPLPTINFEHVNKLIETLSDPEVVMLALGPLAELHSSNENDNIVMRYVMGVLRLIAQKADVAVVTDHHTSKPPMAAPDAWIGNQYAARGGSSIPGAARRVLTLFSATEQDCIDAGIPSKDRRQFVRIDNGKASYSPPGEGTQWLRWQSVQLWNGDNVGVLVSYDVSARTKTASESLAGLLATSIRGSGSATMPIDEALKIMARDPIMAKEDRSVLRNRLERLLQEPLQVDGVELSMTKVGSRYELVVR